MSGVVVGRERVMVAADRLLEQGDRGFAALVVEGEPGIGKTTVWRETVRRAESAGYRVLRSRPAAAEATLAFASLGDLFEQVGAEHLARLPRPQQEALETALLLAEGGGRRADARAVGAAVRSLLGSLGDEPTLLAIDDVQWLDRSSAAALTYAFRRVGPSTPLRVLLALRVIEADSAAASLVTALEEGTELVRLGPLSLSSLFHVISAQLGRAFPKPVLQRIEQASGGNPLFAVELARALAEADELPASGDPLPVPDSLGGLLTRRVTKLPADVRETLLACALLSRPTVDLLEAALGPDATTALETALADGIVEVRGSEVRFGHPLLANAVASSVLPARRQAMHQRLADSAGSAEERARHLALASDRPSATVADGLADAALRAWDRGASADAVELLELACRFTPVELTQALAVRRVELASMLHHAGDSREAARLLDTVLGDHVMGPVRARGLELRAQIHWVAGTSEEAETCCTEAMAHTAGDLHLQGRILVTLARVTLDAEVLLHRSRSALDFLESVPDPDPGLLAEALIGLASGLFYTGNGMPADVVERALALEEVAPSPNVSDRMSAALGTWLKNNGDFEEARGWLERTRQAAIDEGDEGSLPFALSHLPQLELWAGRWQDAESLAAEHLKLAERTGQSLERFTAIFSLAMVDAHRGRLDRARGRLMPALAEAESGDPWAVYQLLSALGFVELSAGRYPDAVAALGRAFDIYESTGAGDAPGVFENYPEALVRVGDVDRALEVVELFEQRARTMGRALAIAPALRCRALVAESHGELERAVTLLREALSHHDQVAMPFSRARTELVLGRVERRRGERRAARQVLESAVALFTALGAPHWADLAAKELGRVPIRRAAAADSLTPTEARVAELVAEGLTNKEIALALFVTDKTVEANLTRIYRKLGVRSRTELVARPGPPTT